MINLIGICLGMQNNQVISHHQDEPLTCFRRLGIPPKTKSKKTNPLAAVSGILGIWFCVKIGGGLNQDNGRTTFGMLMMYLQTPHYTHDHKIYNKGSSFQSILVYHLTRCLLILMVIFPFALLVFWRVYFPFLWVNLYVMCALKKLITGWVQNAHPKPSAHDDGNQKSGEKTRWGLVVEIPLFTTGFRFRYPFSGWEWDFWAIKSTWFKLGILSNLVAYYHP